MKNHLENLQALIDPVAWASLSMHAMTALKRICRDADRIDWLADRDNDHGAVQLPAICVQENLSCMRSAIDAAMKLDAQERTQ